MLHGIFSRYEPVGNDRVYMLADHLGTIAAETDNRGTQIYRGWFSPYGAGATSTGSPGRFGWIGSYGYRDAAWTNGNHPSTNYLTSYVRARHYSRTQARWTTVDPLYPNESAYGYVDGRSSKEGDPSGYGPNSLKNLKCDELKRRLTETIKTIQDELSKYNPYTDPLGGIALVTGKPWHPWGHWEKIGNLRNRLLNALKEWYQKQCDDHDDLPPGTMESCWAPIPRILPKKFPGGLPEPGMPGFDPPFPRPRPSSIDPLPGLILLTCIIYPPACFGTLARPAPGVKPAPGLGGFYPPLVNPDDPSTWV